MGRRTDLHDLLDAQARAHDGQGLERRSEIALTRGSRTGLSLLAFQAVGREGLETMVSRCDHLRELTSGRHALNTGTCCSSVP